MRMKPRKVDRYLPKSFIVFLLLSVYFDFTCASLYMYIISGRSSFVVKSSLNEDFEKRLSFKKED